MTQRSRHIPNTLFPIAVLVGVVCGLVGVFIHYLITLAIIIVFGNGPDADFLQFAEQLPLLWRLLLPTLGGLLIGLIVWYGKYPEVAGEGIPELQRAITHDAAKIPWPVAPLKTLSIIIAIGSGGSVGREGPLIQIGGTIGSYLSEGRSFITEHRISIVLAGAAAIMAATFGTPVAAVIFTFEVLHRKTGRLRLILIVIATLIAVFITRGFFGYEGLRLSVPIAEAITWLQYLWYGLVGVVAGLVAVLFGVLLHGVAAIMKRLPLHAVCKPALGGFLVGSIACLTPFIYEPVTFALFGTVTSGIALSLPLILVIILAKLVATALSIGSGGSGGIFAPSLILGLLISAAGNVLAVTVGGQVFDPVMAIVAMAAVFAATAHAPITAAVMLIEITELPQVFPALLLATMFSYGTAWLLLRRSMYRIH